MSVSRSVPLLAFAVACALSTAPAHAKGPADGCVADGPANGTQQRWTCTQGPITVDGYEVKQNGLGLSSFGAPKPPVDGHIVAMDVDVVDSASRPVPISRLMLHHIVFANVGARFGDKRDATCNTFTNLDSATKIPALAERFYAAGEERAVMALPAGYGYPTAKADSWVLTWMLMNHRKQRDTAWIQYHVTTDTAPAFTPVTPYWLDVENCKADPVYSVPGGAAKGSTHEQRSTFTMPTGARIVASAGHVHGGAKELEVAQPGCAGRTLLRSRPAWGTSKHPFYRVRPILHEPGPISMSATLSGQGIPVAAGEALELISRYDAELPHTRVMGIDVLYAAHDPAVTQPCGALPADLTEITTSLAHRTRTPRFRTPLTGLNRKGRAVSIKRPPGRTIKLRTGSTIVARDNFFSKRNVSVRRGTTLRWRFASKRALHDVTVADGPEGFAAPHLDEGRTYSKKLTRKGTYKVFCSLHPVAMTGTIRVR